MPSVVLLSSVFLSRRCSLLSKVVEFFPSKDVCKGGFWNVTFGLFSRFGWIRCEFIVFWVSVFMETWSWLLKVTFGLLVKDWYWSDLLTLTSFLLTGGVYLIKGWMLFGAILMLIGFFECFSSTLWFFGGRLVNFDCLFWCSFVDRYDWLFSTYFVFLGAVNFGMLFYGTFPLIVTLWTCFGERDEWWCEGICFSLSFLFFISYLCLMKGGILSSLIDYIPLFAICLYLKFIFDVEAEWALDTGDSLKSRWTLSES